MKFINSIICMVALMTSYLVFASAIPSDPTEINRGGDLPHPRGELSFTGTVGGHTVSLQGDAQSIVAQVHALHPDFDPASFLGNTTTVDQNFARGASNKDGIICHPVPGQSWDWAYRPPINAGISYLQGLKGGCNVPATTCVRISCSYSAAIFLCNDNKYSIQPNCGYLASYATDIANTPNCQLNLPSSAGFVCGQEFDSDYYNIIVRYDAC